MNTSKQSSISEPQIFPKFGYFFTKISGLSNDPLFKNSAYIMLTSLSIAGFGLLFWILAANLYSNEDVGVASAILSSISMITLLSKFGFDQSIIRYFPHRNKSHILSTSVIITSIIAIALSVTLIVLGDIISPAMSLLKDYAIQYIIISTLSAITPILGYAFVAMRMGRMYFIQGLFQNLRLIFLFLFVFIGSMGIISSIGISLVLTVAFSIIVLYIQGIKPSKLSRVFLRESWSFSMKNYLSGVLLAVPSLTIPLMVLNSLGSEQTAYYYLSFSIASVLFIVPNAINISLFVEGSHGESLRKCTLKSAVALFAVLLPGVLFIGLFGGNILSIIGSEYSEGLELLNLLAVSSFFVAICQVYISIKKVQKDMNIVILLSSLIFALLLGISYLLIKCNFGIASIGYAWILGYGLSATAIVVIALKDGWL